MACKSNYNDSKYTKCSYSIDGSFNCNNEKNSCIEQFVSVSTDTNTILQLNVIKNKNKSLFDKANKSIFKPS